MSDDKILEGLSQNGAEEALGDGLTRRNLMGKALTGLGAGAILASCDFISETEARAEESAGEGEEIQQTANEHARKESLPPEAFERPRYIAPKQGEFDLSDPLDNHMAWMKVQSDINGGVRYIGQYGWLLVCPPGKPAFPILGRLTLIKTFLVPATDDLAPNVGENDVAIMGTMTTTHVDPRTFKPVDQVYNPYLDKTIDVPTINYADALVYRVGQSIIVPGVDPAFYDQPWDRDGGYSQFNISAGKEISYVVLGAAQHDGAFQPRCDVGFWTANRADLMDPNKSAVDIRRDYSVIQKLTEYSWYGAPAGDEAQLFGHLTGWSCGDPAELPQPIKQHIYDVSGDRFKYD